MLQPSLSPLVLALSIVLLPSAFSSPPSALFIDEAKHLSDDYFRGVIDYPTYTYRREALLSSHATREDKALLEHSSALLFTNRAYQFLHGFIARSATHALPTPLDEECLRETLGIDAHEASEHYFTAYKPILNYLSSRGIYVHRDGTLGLAHWARLWPNDLKHDNDLQSYLAEFTSPGLVAVLLDETRQGPLTLGKEWFHFDDTYVILPPPTHNLNSTRRVYTLSSWEKERDFQGQALTRLVNRQLAVIASQGKIMVNLNGSLVDQLASSEKDVDKQFTDKLGTLKDLGFAPDEFTIAFKDKSFPLTEAWGHVKAQQSLTKAAGKDARRDLFISLALAGGALAGAAIILATAPVVIPILGKAITGASFLIGGATFAFAVTGAKSVAQALIDTKHQRLSFTDALFDHLINNTTRTLAWMPALGLLIAAPALVAPAMLLGASNLTVNLVDSALTAKNLQLLAHRTNDPNLKNDLSYLSWMEGLNALTSLTQLFYVAALGKSAYVSPHAGKLLEMPLKPPPPRSTAPTYRIVENRVMYNTAPAPLRLVGEAGVVHQLARVQNQPQALASQQIIYAPTEVWRTSREQEQQRQDGYQKHIDDHKLGRDTAENWNEFLGLSGNGVVPTEQSGESDANVLRASAGGESNSGSPSEEKESSPEKESTGYSLNFLTFDFPGGVPNFVVYFLNSLDGIDIRRGPGNAYDPISVERAEIIVFELLQVISGLQKMGIHLKSQDLLNLRLSPMANYQRLQPLISRFESPAPSYIIKARSIAHMYAKAVWKRDHPDQPYKPQLLGHRPDQVLKAFRERMGDQPELPLAGSTTNVVAFLDYVDNVMFAQFRREGFRESIKNIEEWRRADRPAGGKLQRHRFELTDTLEGFVWVVRRFGLKTKGSVLNENTIRIVTTPAVAVESQEGKQGESFLELTLTYLAGPDQGRARVRTYVNGKVIEVSDPLLTAPQLIPPQQFSGILGALVPEIVWDEAHGFQIRSEEDDRGN